MRMYSIGEEEVAIYALPPTRSRGMILNSRPCLRKILPAVWLGLMPTPSFVMIALVPGFTLNS